MSGYYYQPDTSAREEDDFDFSQALQSQPNQFQPEYSYVFHPPALGPHQFYQDPQSAYQQPQQYPQTVDLEEIPGPAWLVPNVPSTYNNYHHDVVRFPQYSDAAAHSPNIAIPAPSRASIRYLSPDEAGRTRASRATSLASDTSSRQSHPGSDVSRSVSPNASEMAKWGFKNKSGSWSCAYPRCTSKSTFNRGCDLRKHYKRHTKSLFCRHEGCPQATGGGFSSKKDRARHEAKHNPDIVCEWEGCDRLFSRVDNMKDHVRRIHKPQATQR